jgi:hypothetical protein
MHRLSTRLHVLWNVTWNASIFSLITKNTATTMIVGIILVYHRPSRSKVSKIAITGNAVSKSPGQIRGMQQCVEEWFFLQCFNMQDDQILPSTFRDQELGDRSLSRRRGQRGGGGGATFQTGPTTPPANRSRLRLMYRHSGFPLIVGRWRNLLPCEIHLYRRSRW